MSETFKPVKTAILGFVNGHIPNWYNQARNNPNIEIATTSTLELCLASIYQYGIWPLTKPNIAIFTGLKVSLIMLPRLR